MILSCHHISKAFVENTVLSDVTFHLEKGEKAAIVGAPHGVAKFRKNTINVNTSVGLQNSGYGIVNGKTVPVPLIANAINSGTSFMEKQPFMRKAFSQSKGSAMQAIEEELKTRLEEMSEI